VPSGTSEGGEAWQTDGKRRVGQVDQVLVTTHMLSKKARYTRLANEEDHIRGSVRKRYKDRWNIILDIALPLAIC